MKIDGKLIAESIKILLKDKLLSLTEKKIIPQLAIVLVGEDPSSLNYVAQKQKIGEELEIKILLCRLKNTDSQNELINLVYRLNTDQDIHGIIIQRPVPIGIDREELDNLVIPEKDLDGFHPDSPFTPPVASAVVKILKWVYKGVRSSSNSRSDPEFPRWLKDKKILIIGRGETGGKPVAQTLEKMGIRFIVAHSKTNNLKELCLTSDIIISCVGKPNIVRPQMVADYTILIGVGLHEENGKLQTDYNQHEIAEKVAYYTPVPGGVGPVNVIYLFENLLKFMV